MEETTGICASVSPPEKATVTVTAAPCGAGLLGGLSVLPFAEAECRHVGTAGRVTVTRLEGQDRKGSGMTPWSSLFMAGGLARRPGVGGQGADVPSVH